MWINIYNGVICLLNSGNLSEFAQLFDISMPIQLKKIFYFYKTDWFIKKIICSFS